MALDSVGQEIQLGDLVVFRRQYRRAPLRFGRIITVNPDTIRIVFYNQRYIDGLIQDSYSITGSVESNNCIVIEREFVQPQLKDRLNEWNSKKKKPDICEFLGMSNRDIGLWARQRCISLER